jgi:allene oxide cyclase
MRTRETGLPVSRATQIFIVATGLLASSPTLAAQSFTAVERATTDSISVHGGKAADNVGDILTFSNDIFDAANKVKIGTDQGFCVRLVVGKSFECHWTTMLAKGQITVDGPFLDAGDSVLSVTGGTGDFAQVRGEMRLHARDAKGSAYDFVYLLK